MDRFADYFLFNFSPRCRNVHGGAGEAGAGGPHEGRPHLHWSRPRATAGAGRFLHQIRLGDRVRPGGRLHPVPAGPGGARGRPRGGDGRRLLRGAICLRGRVQEGQHDGQCWDHCLTEEDGLQRCRDRHRWIIVQVKPPPSIALLFNSDNLQVPSPLQERDAEQDLPDDGHQLQVRPPPLRGRIRTWRRPRSRRPEEG